MNLINLINSIVNQYSHDQRQTYIWFLKIFRCRKLIIFTGMSLSRVWKLYQEKEKSLLIAGVLFILWIVLGIIRKAKNKKKNRTIAKIYNSIITLLLYNKDFVKSVVTVPRLIRITVEFQFHYFVLTHFITLLLWLQFCQRDFTTIIGSKFIRITVFKLNKKTLIPS